LYNRFSGSIQNQRAFLTVDGTHFRLYEPYPFNKKWFSHKFKSAGITYEIGLNVQNGHICWAYGGYPAGVSDITMARKGILRVLPPGEMIIADKGYQGESSRIITPVAQTGHPMNRQHKLIMARHEHINKRIKDFSCMSGVWRHGWQSHVLMFYAVVALTQIKIENGEPMPGPY